MNITTALNTPVRTLKSGIPAKTLQLTPVWEEVLKNNRLPPNISQNLIFKEISNRLEDFEWPVRQHAFRVLYDIISVLPKDRLDKHVNENNIFKKMIINMGHSAPGIRKVASEIIQKYLKETSQFEKNLNEYLQFGIVDENQISNDQIGILRENVTLGAIMSLIDVLKPFIKSRSGRHSITHNYMTKIIEALVNQTKNLYYRVSCLETLWKLRELIGKQRFLKILESIPENDLILDLMNLRGTIKDFQPNETTWESEPKSDHHFEETKKYLTNTVNESDEKAKEIKEKPYIITNESSEEGTDGTDTETYTKEPAANDFDENQNISCINGSDPIDDNAFSGFVPIDEKVQKENEERTCPLGHKVLPELEYQNGQHNIVNMNTISNDGDEGEDEEDDEEDDDDDDDDDEENDNSNDFLMQKRFTTEDGDFVMKVLPNSEEIKSEEKIRTPRRVRFGGEVIKLRTPDSDTTDMTLEIQEGDNRDINKSFVQEESEIAKYNLDLPNSKLPSPSQIPLPVTPATTSPKKNNVFKMKTVYSPNMIENNSYFKNNSFDSNPSSSGSDNELKEKWEKDSENNFWKWLEFHLVEENIVKDLKNKDDWKIQYQALEHLKQILTNPISIEKIKNVENSNLISSLFKCLLYKFPEDHNQQITTLSLSIVNQLIENLPKDIIRKNIEIIVPGLCSFVAGFRNVNIKIESIQTLKTLFNTLEPSTIINVLIGKNCLFSSKTKLRENALLAIMYATMTFPSSYFDVDKILEKVSDSTTDSRRRVRHAALEAIAVLAQFCSPKTIADNITRVGEKMPTSLTKAELTAAIQARLSRRVLPSISNEGLVLYALQIPASKRFGIPGNPMGADVDWILSGSGSISTGSAKTKTQLNAASRLDIKPATPLSPNKWSSTKGGKGKNSSNNPDENGVRSATNPWTIQKNKKESEENHNKKNNENTIITESNNCKKPDDNILTELNDKDKKENTGSQEATWALVPLSALDETNFTRDKNGNPWGDAFNDSSSPQYWSPSLGYVRPLYLKLNPNQEQYLFSRSTDDISKISCIQNLDKKGEKYCKDDLSEVRLLTPSILREKNSDGYFQNKKNGKNGYRENATKIPVLQYNQKNVQKPLRSTNGSEKKVIELENHYSSSPSLKSTTTALQNSGNGFSESPVFLPNIHSSNHEDLNYDATKSYKHNKLDDVDEIKIEDTISQFSGLLSNSKSGNKQITRDFHSSQIQPLDSHINYINFSDKDADISTSNDDKFQNTIVGDGFNINSEPFPNSVNSAPPIINTNSRDQTPSTSSSNSIDIGTYSGSELRLRRHENDHSSSNNRRLYRNYGSNVKQKNKKPIISKSANKIGVSRSPFPTNTKPFEKPKESLETCFNQLESQQWEVNMLGLNSLVRLLRHHPSIVLGQLHSIIVALGQQIRNLRSQVARTACQVSAEMFLILKRNVELDLEELSGPLFHRSADTNRFIRADCNDALDNMVDNVGHAKAVSVIISKGIMHQNATVRAVAARLLLRLSEKVGPEKLLALPKEIREKMLLSGANLLTEGKLETRAFAKQVFRIWSSHPSFNNLLLEAVPPNIMRQISKTLISLKS